MSHLLPHRRGLGRDKHAKTDLKKKQELAAEATGQSWSEERQRRGEAQRAERREREERSRCEEAAQQASIAAGGFVGAGMAASGFGGMAPGGGGLGGGGPGTKVAKGPRRLELSAQRLNRNGLHAHNYGLFENALEAFDAALAKPEAGDTPQIRAECLANKAVTLVATGEAKRALHCATEARGLDPKQPRAYLALAMAYDGLGEPMESMAAIADGTKAAARSGDLFGPAVELIKPKLQALTKLKDAAEKGDLAEVEALTRKLDAFGFPRMKSLSVGEPRRETTAAHAAMAGGQVAVIRFLGAEGYDLTVPDCEGDDVLAALLFGDRGRGGKRLARGDAWKAVAAALLDAGADPKRVDANGATVLHRAIDVGDIDVAVFLHSRDASVLAARDRGGRTPLHVACAVPGAANEIMKHGCVEWLLVHGGPDLLLHKDRKGRVPLAALDPEADAVDARLKKWVSAWLRLARKHKLVGRLPPPPPYGTQDGTVVETPRDGRVRGYRAAVPENDVKRPAEARFKPEIHAIPIKDQYKRFDTISHDIDDRE